MGNKTGTERELKFRDVELDPLRQRLVELAAERSGPGSFEENWIFDRKGALQKEGKVLRLRKDTNGASLTLKGPSEFEGRIKVREEHETEIGDADTARALLEGLGYQMVKRYQKVREEWRLGSVTIALDHTPIGDFAEFEGEAAERVARRCGFEPEEAERRSYLRLYDDHRRDNPEAPEDMLFPDRT
jgi:adenylate cyclase, class 2